MRSIPPADCARACQQLSLRLDSELSEFEGMLLEAHLAACRDCRAFEQSITALTTAIREAPAEYPTVSIHLPRRRSRVDALFAGSLRAGSAVAAIVVVALTGLMALNRAPEAVPGADLRDTRAVLDLHERRLQQLDRFGQTLPVVIPRGLAAAAGEPTAGVNAAQSSSLAPSTRRRQGRR